jgi:DNA-binding transcriptional MerR regulator
MGKMGKNVLNIYTIKMLADKTGLSIRTVRYYIHRRLLPPPFGKKRGSYYTDLHLNRIQLINKLESQGVPICKILTTLNCPNPEEPGESKDEDATTWREAELFEGIRISYLPNILTRSELKKVQMYINEMMRDKGHASKAERRKSKLAAKDAECVPL